MPENMEDSVRLLAKRAIEDFRRDGRVGDGHHPDLSLRNELTPGRVILSACQLLLHLEAAAHNRRTAAEPGSQNLTAALLGDIGAAIVPWGRRASPWRRCWLACARRSKGRG